MQGDIVSISWVKYYLLNKQSSKKVCIDLGQKYRYFSGIDSISLAICIIN